PEAPGRWSVKSAWEGQETVRGLASLRPFLDPGGAWVSIRYGDSCSEQGTFMRVIAAPEEWSGQQRSRFLAGGISGCGDWQSRLVGLLNGLDLVALNPRRDNYP